MSDIPIREMKGHDILAVERFRDSTCRMIEFVVRKQGNPYGSPGDEMRLFLSEAGYRRALVCGDTVDEAMKNDIAIAERLRITATTLDGLLTVKGQGREKGGNQHG